MHQFKLINRRTNQVEPLGVVDDRLCDYLGARSNPDQFLDHWVDYLKLDLAAPDFHWDDIAENWANDDGLIPQIIEFLQDNYLVRNSYIRGSK